MDAQDIENIILFASLTTTTGARHGVLDRLLELESGLAGVIGVILVGGQSRRYGHNKAMEVFHGERLIDRQVRIVGSLFPEVIVVTHRPELYLHLEVTIVRDVIPRQGPLGGIYTGLLFARGQSVFVTACDMPFVQPAVIRRMVELADDYDVVVPEKKAGLEPLHAIYSSRCLPHIKRMLARQELQVIRFFPSVRVYRLGSEEIGQLDPSNLTFFNINTPDDMEKARELFEEVEVREDSEAR